MIPTMVMAMILTAITMIGDRIFNKRMQDPTPVTHRDLWTPMKEADLFKEIATAWAHHSEHWFIKDYVVEPVGRWNW